MVSIVKKRQALEISISYEFNSEPPNLRVVLPIPIALRDRYAARQAVLPAS
jgi:hypothetical protein